MGNIIRLNEDASTEKWLKMSNRGTDVFLELLLLASESIEHTQTQKKLIDYLWNQKNVNDVAPGTAGFDIEDMPWTVTTLSEDIQFLVTVTELAKSKIIWEKIDIELEESIINPRFDMFEDMLKEFMPAERAD